MDTRKVGVLGGGQLGRMFAAAASLLNIHVIILDTGDNAPAKQIIAHGDHIDGSFADAAKIRELAAKVDVLTVEIEHVDASVLAEIAKTKKVRVHPDPETLAIIQDKYRQKAHLESLGSPVSTYMPVEPTLESVQAAAKQLSLPLMLKSRTLAYDGRGNFVLGSLDQVQDALTFLGNRPLYAEKWVPFVKEVAVMVVRSESGEVRAYPAVETVHQNNICHLVYVPLRVPDAAVPARAEAVAKQAVQSFAGAGVFGVEMFLLADGGLLINEIAPRPHNSGHYTIEACLTSQYENHLRAILDLPLGSTALKVSAAAMMNLLGTSDSFDDVASVAREALEVEGASVHLYGKSGCRKGRKMGHITVVGDSDAQVHERLQPLLSASSSSSHTSDRMHHSHSHPRPLVGIIMGSDSDLPVMLPAARILDDFEIPYELTIVSAHRTPERMFYYARTAAARGLRVIVAGAGGAAHLPGMVAALTALPIIGVPVKGSSLDGLDSLHSIVQMPRGVPVATVAINGGMNAGLLAVRILGAASPALVSAMESYQKRLEGEVVEKVGRLEEIGWEEYQRSSADRTKLHQ